MKTKAEINFRDIPHNLAYLKVDNSEYANCHIKSCYTCKYFQCLAWSDDPDADLSEFEQGNCHNDKIEKSLEINCSNETICNLYEVSEYWESEVNE